jgi:ABC-type glycerol-3-phosphate transport system substrate-binding protein
MKRLSLLVVALGVLVSACGSSSTSPTTPTNPTFTATLSPANEVPAIQGAEASGSGTATVTMVTT